MLLGVGHVCFVSQFFLKALRNNVHTEKCANVLFIELIEHICRVNRVNGVESSVNFHTVYPEPRATFKIIIDVAKYHFKKVSVFLFPSHVISLSMLYHPREWYLISVLFAFP